MEYMPNGRKSGHKRGREEFSDDEDDPNDFATKRKKSMNKLVCGSYVILLTMSHGKRGMTHTFNNIHLGDMVVGV
ncbi:hypothetical protein FRX31_031141 [Thalictrum thalictroides]|uniref:Uncharacterized protein n=1 Tax=Thalictrum thalictroides TaxID=46969 RepID=A0A7J6V4D6_THATH|nr:hypothetical protein FRX31_031141 [Thalictrum thalictroides]